jgi:class 3 adenylate cyclase
MVEGWSSEGRGTQMAEYLRAAISQDGMRRLASDLRHYDVSDLLPKVQAKTLVMHGDQNTAVLMDTVRKMTSQIPNAELVVTQGRDGHSGRDWDAMKRVIPQFLGVDATTLVANDAPQGTAIILFADIASSTALTERLGDSAFRDKARTLDEALREAITNAGGTAVEGKLLGDGVLAVFTSTRDAITCAGACHAAATDNDLQLHIGVHAGDVIREGGNVFGGAVNIAARVSDASGAGETFVSQTVRDLARTSAGVAFDDRGEHALKGIDEPQRLFAVTY